MTDILDLDARPGPDHAPRTSGWRALNAKVPPDLWRWATAQADAEGCTVSTWLRHVVEREAASRRHDLSDTGYEWLMIEAAQLGIPGDPWAALEAVLEHLADRWPRGARLRP